MYGLFSGATTRNRTADLRITSALLYQLSYGGAIICNTVIRELHKILIPFPLVKFSLPVSRLKSAFPEIVLY